MVTQVDRKCLLQGHGDEHLYLPPLSVLPFALFGSICFAFWFSTGILHPFTLLTAVLSVARLNILPQKVGSHFTAFFTLHLPLVCAEILEILQFLHFHA